jgi:hypothetical protein
MLERYITKVVVRRGKFGDWNLSGYKLPIENEFKVDIRAIFAEIDIET